MRSTARRRAPQSHASFAAKAEEGGRARAATFKRLGLELSVLSLAVLLLLAILGSQVDWSALPLVNAFNDQARYVTTARHWLDTGRYEHLGIGIIFSNPEQQRGVIYMPGYFACLAASYWLFGYGVWQSLLPGIISFWIAEMAIFLAARRLFGCLAASLAAALFAASPLNQLYAFIAMAELPFVAAVATVIAIFVWLPNRYRVLASPPLLALPFLFRDTAALAVVLFAALVWADAGIRRATTLVVLSAAALLAIHQMPFSKHRPSRGAANFVESEEAKYTDAVAHSEIKLTAEDVLRLLPGRVWRQLGSIFPTAYPATVSVYLLHGGLLTLATFGLVGGIWRCDGWLAGTAGMSLCLVLLSAAFYTCAGMTFSRNSMFVFVPGSILAGRGLAAALDSALARRSRLAFRIACFALLAFLWASGIFYCRAENVVLAFGSKLDRQAVQDVSALAAPPRPGELALLEMDLEPTYLVERYPATCALLPTNYQTFSTLQRHWRVSLMVTYRELTPDELGALGMEYRGSAIYRRFDPYLVLQEIPFYVYASPPSDDSALDDDR